MQVLVKALVSVTVILAASTIAKGFPSAAGLIGVMPLTGALVLAWVHMETGGDRQVTEAVAGGALWGIGPSLLFFLVALLCLRRGFPLAAVLGASFGAWLIGALIHQWALK